MSEISRRQFARRLSGLSVAAYAATSKPSLFAAQVSDDKLRPNVTSGVASGDVDATSAVIWSRADRPSRMLVEVANNEQFRNGRKLQGPDVFDHSDFTAKIRLNALNPGERYFYRVSFQDLDNLKSISAPVTGQFKTAASEAKDIKFIWSGDTAGQGYGIDLARGGMKSFDTIAKLEPDFFVNSGDVIYADNPFAAEVKLDDGTVWKNIVTEETSKVAETLGEFRANYRYNLLDENVRRMNSLVPLMVQWDDHEVLNNWYPTEQLADDRYKVKSVSLLAARARQAFMDYLPIRASADGSARIYRNIAYGPLLDVFFLDQRSYRAPNSPNRQDKSGPDTAFMGNPQINWLKKKLSESRATWKVICSDMPIGLVVSDGAKDFENCANGDGPALGRELEIADLLSHMKRAGVKNTVWLTADVHYAASHYYNPNRAVFQDFDPFWEFVSGPLHAGTFGPGKFDNTFGPELKFKSIPEGMKGNRPPSDGLQFFGQVSIDGQSRALTVTHFNAAGKKLSSQTLEA